MSEALRSCTVVIQKGHKKVTIISKRQLLSKTWLNCSLLYILVPIHSTRVQDLDAKDYKVVIFAHTY